jgi:hypothetical protein
MRMRIEMMKGETIDVPWSVVTVRLVPMYTVVST